MKKKVLRAFSILLPITFILMACGCPAKKEVIKTTVPDGPFDPMGYLREEEAFITEFKGFYMLRDGVTYSLNGVTSIKDKDEYNPGEIKESYGYQALYDASQDSSWYYYWTLGEFDIPVIHDSDEVRSYGISEVSLFKVEDLNYGYIMDMSGNGLGIPPKYVVTTEGRIGVNQESKEFKCVCGDTELETNYNLEKGDEVTISWFLGTDYYEYKAIADSRFYKIKSIVNEDYKIEGELCKEGYAKYDFSEVEPGLYFFHSVENNTNLKYGEKQLIGNTLVIIE